MDEPNPLSISPIQGGFGGSSTGVPTELEMAASLMEDDQCSSVSDELPAWKYSSEVAAVLFQFMSSNPGGHPMICNQSLHPTSMGSSDKRSLKQNSATSAMAMSISRY
ncbi:hypothetical protein HPP92_003664 [Vanilla planifolia]|uniref:Uncharacterized protein n=1 Tax=Vanilla planifolia TaxID=51239 RepID=A0A835S3R4_VANPL|nr:hypothetical protein HPP92_004117 [Vanilla planifolia]KAG0503592.1 hypothetical protein HPP92_003664 [Vanilla planifolia]